MLLEPFYESQSGDDWLIYSSRAQLEGWDVLEDGETGILQIGRIDAMGRFKDDYLAEIHVTKRAAAGCLVASKAFSLVGKVASERDEGDLATIL